MTQTQLITSCYITEIYQYRLILGNYCKWVAWEWHVCQAVKHQCKAHCDLQLRADD